MVAQANRVFQRPLLTTVEADFQNSTDSFGLNISSEGGNILARS